MSSMAAQTERARTTFTATAQPSGAPSGVIGDCYRTPARLRGDFAAGVFSLALPVIAVTSGGDQDGRVRMRIWRSRFNDGANATELTAATAVGTGVTNLSTALAQVSTATVTFAAFALAREYLFFQLAWEITGQAGSITRDVLIRNGVDALILTTDFTATTYTLWTDTQLTEDAAEYQIDHNTLRGAYIADRDNATHEQMNDVRREMLKIVRQQLLREGESAADIGGLL